MNYTKPAVLILNHHDRVEVFAERGAAKIHIENVPHVAGTPAEEILAEQYLDASLPRWIRGTYFPANLRASELLRTWAPSGIARRDAELSVIRACDQIAGWREVFIC